MSLSNCSLELKHAASTILRQTAVQLLDADFFEHQLSVFLLLISWTLYKQISGTADARDSSACSVSSAFDASFAELLLFFCHQ